MLKFNTKYYVLNRAKQTTARICISEYQFVPALRNEQLFATMDLTGLEW